MAIWSELRNLVRWLFRRPEPPQPGTGQRYQANEQAQARRRLLRQAERLRETRCHEPIGTVPTLTQAMNGDLSRPGAAE